MLKILQQLVHNNVTTLNIANSHFCYYMMHSHHDFYSALKVLICPSSGKLEKLCIGCGYFGDDCSDRLACLVSGPSSLKSLSLVFHSSFASHVPYLRNNTCLTTLHLKFPHGYSKEDEISPAIAEIVEHNKTLQHLELSRVII